MEFYDGNIIYYNTSDCPGGWNLTSDSIAMSVAGSITKSDEITVIFQTAFPYIALFDEAFQNLV